MKRQFTMIEMVVVVVIIASLAAVATPMYFSYVKDSRISAAKLQIDMLKQAVNAYRMSTGKLPPAESGLDILVRNVNNDKSWKGPFIDGTAIPLDPWGNPYVYKVPGENADFEIISYGADGKTGGEGENADLGSTGTAQP